jgi:hypothetical protein
MLARIAMQACRGVRPDQPGSALAYHHIGSSWVYEPASRFWPLQAIEAGIFLALSAACIGLAVWWIKQRIA